MTAWHVFLRLTPLILSSHVVSHDQSMAWFRNVPQALLQRRIRDADGVPPDGLLVRVSSRRARARTATPMTTAPAPSPATAPPATPSSSASLAPGNLATYTSPRVANNITLVAQLTTAKS